jgi:hypothetical protein
MNQSFTKDRKVQKKKENSYLVFIPERGIAVHAYANSNSAPQAPKNRTRNFYSIVATGH